MIGWGASPGSSFSLANEWQGRGIFLDTPDQCSRTCHVLMAIVPRKVLEKNAFVQKIRG